VSWPLRPALSAEACLAQLQRFLLLAYRTLREPRDDRTRLFAFRLHQFIAGAGDLFATLEAPAVRYLDVKGQQFQPGQPEKRLFNTVFCRECGQEYFPVWASGPLKDPESFEPRELSDRSREDDEEVAFGLLMPDPEGIWSDAEVAEAFPEEWLDHARAEPRLRSNYNRYRPIRRHVTADGACAGEGLPTWYIPAPFASASTVG